MKKPEYVLGLDISTSTVGCAIIDAETDEIKSLFYISLKKEKGLLNKARLLQSELEAQKIMPDHVAIEAPLVMFKEGFSRAQVLSMLSQFNGMSQFMTFLLYKVDPILYNVSTARKLSYPDLKFPRGTKRKELVQERTALEYPDIEFPLKRTGRLKDECYDMCDAVVIARAHSKSMREGLIE